MHITVLIKFIYMNIKIEGCKSMQGWYRSNEVIGDARDGTSKICKIHTIRL